MYKDCPSDELEICWWYEYAREGVRGFSGSPGSLFPSDPREPELYPEWPGKPYLLIPGLERARRLRQLAGRTGDYLHSLNLKPPFQSHPELKLAPARRELRRQLRYRWPISQVGSEAWLVPFRIDWRRSDREIRADFAAWLREYRPKALTSGAHSKTGAGAVLRQLKTELKALGALRLLRHYKNQQNLPEEAARLYRGQASWIKAQQKAESRLKLFRL